MSWETNDRGYVGTRNLIGVTCLSSRRHVDWLAAGVRHHRWMRDLVALNGRWWDWQVDRWDVAGLRLIADNDLTYHHSVEVTFTDVAWVACADLFHHPVFRLPTTPETAFMRQVATEGEHHLYVWDAETATGTVPMMVVARSVRIVEGIVRH